MWTLFQRLFSAMSQAPDSNLCVSIERITAGLDAANHRSCGQGLSLDEGKLSLASNEPFRLTGFTRQGLDLQRAIL
jgi:hypothetical protein